MAELIMGGGLILTTLNTNIVSYSISSCVNIMKWLITTGDPYYDNVINKLREYDLENRLIILNIMCEEYHVKNNDEIKQDITHSIYEIVDRQNYNIKSKSALMSIMSLEQTISDINIVLSRIKKKIQDHLALYLKNWRTFNCDAELREIDILNKILEKRIDLFVQINNINNHV